MPNGMCESGNFLGEFPYGEGRRRAARVVYARSGNEDWVGVVNFSVLPPEVNSLRILSGAGSGPMLAVATAWGGLGEDLDSTASAFSSVISQVAEAAWQGPAAASMASVAAAYTGWLGAAATGAAEAASQAAAAAAVFETALTATVPLEVVAANRSQLMSMVASNVLGLNAPAIAAAEAHYEQMWAEDVAAMVGYHAGASAAVAQLSPWQNLLSSLSGQLASAGGATTSQAAASAAAATDVTLVVGGSGFPIPSQSYVDTVVADYVTPHFPTFIVSNAQALFTPAESYWITGVKSLTEDASWAQGLTILDSAINSQLSAGNNVLVQGYSQGAGIASLEMAKLHAAGVPSSSVSFSLIGDPMNPNGGLYSRFDGLTLPSLGKTFWGSTPDNYYPTAVYTLEYDGFADFPQYPLNFVSDANAILGMAYVHTQYLDLTPTQVATAVQLPTEGATMTNYYMIPTNNLPLLEPLRTQFPILGAPLADLIQPDLKVIVNLGYGNPDYGYSTGPANVSTPFGLFPQVSATTIASDLVSGTQQGISAAASDISAWQLPSLPDLSSGISNALGSNPSSALSGLTLPPLSASSIDSFIQGLQTANTNVTNVFTNVAATAYATLLPTADTLNAVLTSIPSYDVNLFLDGITQAINGNPLGGLQYAFVAPLAADTGLIMFLGLFNYFAFYDATSLISGYLASLV